MTKTELEKIIKEEALDAACNILEDRPDRANEFVAKKIEDHFEVYQTDEQAKMIDHATIHIGEEQALEMLLSKLRAAKTQEFEQLFKSKRAKRVMREIITKTFLARDEFEASYHELYKTRGRKCFAVLRIDPAPGGYGEEFMYIREVYELSVDNKEKAYTDENLMQLVFSKGEKVKNRSF